MADIRIKDLATTAASTASDDFVAVDGSANGTRKLNAYSPTFGGNLTVSGTGLSSVAGALNVTGALLAHQTAALNMAHEGSSLSQIVSYGADASTYGRLNFTLRKAGTGVGAVTALAMTSTDATFGGNLTVSGTGTSSVAGSLTVGSASSTTTFTNSANGFTVNSATGNALAVFNSSAADAGVTNNAYLTIQTAGVARWYLGQSISAADGNFQIYGAVFGAPILTLNKTTGATTLAGNLTVSGGTVTSGSGTLTLNSSANTVVLQSAGTTALTLDSSQNAIFAGSTGVQLKNDSFLYFGSTVRTAVKGNSTGSLELYANNGLSLTLDSSQNATFAGKITVSGVQNVIGSASPAANFPLRINQGATDAAVTVDIANVSSGTSAAANFQLQSDAGTSFIRQHSIAHAVWPNYLLLGGSDKIAISTDSTANGIELMTGYTTRVNVTTATTTISNDLAINNTVQTAVAVASTHKVTISIGGSTYYLLATNV